MLAEVSKGPRKDLVRAAGALYKSGAEPSDAPPKAHYTRAEMRQAARALGWRGEKAKRHNLERQARLVAQVVMADEALGVAKDRAEHPVRSRLRRR